MQWQMQNYEMKGKQKGKGSCALPNLKKNYAKMHCGAKFSLGYGMHPVNREWKA